MHDEEGSVQGSLTALHLLDIMRSPHAQTVKSAAVAFSAAVPTAVVGADT